jgi:hypothetical protein
VQTVWDLYEELSQSWHVLVVSERQEFNDAGTTSQAGPHTRSPDGTAA